MTDDRTVVVEKEGRSSGAGWFIGIVLVLAVVLGVLFFGKIAGSEVSKDNAVANAANQVGNAAERAGNAAEDAADNVKQ